jgi:hypothetical protein
MEDKVIYRVKDPTSGKFVKKDVKTIRVAACLHPSAYEKLTALIPEGGTISDVLRDAVDLYLGCQDNKTIEN